MASLEGNRAFAAILVAGLAFMVAGLIADVLVHPEADRNAAIAMQGAATAAILPLLAAASRSEGQQIAAQDCGTCHSFSEGGGTLIGPDLYGIVGARVASAAGYPYSDALRKVGGTWTYERLDHWLLDPQGFAPGTLMSYPGMPSAQDRADVVAFLRSLAAVPVPLPAGANP